MILNTIGSGALASRAITDSTGVNSEIDQIAYAGSVPVARDTNFLKVAKCNNASPHQVSLDLIHLKTGACMRPHGINLSAGKEGYRSIRPQTSN